MDIIDFVCPILRTPYIERLMIAVAYFGHGSVGSVIGLLLLAHGYFYSNQRTQRAGIAVLLALILAGIAAEISKAIIQSPKPKLGTSGGFVSGHTSAAFALASVLSAVCPALGPIFYLLALLTALSRLYFRAYFAWNVAGGAIIGLVAGIPIAKSLIIPSRATGCGPLKFVAWLGVIAFGATGLAYFNFVDRNIRIHLVKIDTAQGVPAVATMDFGTAQARNFLQFGWSEDELWLGGKQSVVWAQGLASALAMELPGDQDYRFRLRIFPYSPTGLACQRIEVKLNGDMVAKLFLERGWHSYDFRMPRTAIKAGKNDLQFFYEYAESPTSRRRSSDERALSVAFDKLEVYTAREP